MSKGNAVGNLQKEDFELFDNRKPQIISHFSVEQPGAQAAKERLTSDANPGEQQPSVPERYIALVFDDIHLKFGDLVRREWPLSAISRLCGPRTASAIFSTSGQTTSRLHG